MANQPSCDLCRRVVAELTRHHLIPRTRHKNKRNKRLFERKDVQERIIMLCRPCHKHVHAHLTEKELEHQYNTLEALATHPEIEKFVAWISQRPGLIYLPVRQSKTK